MSGKTKKVIIAEDGTLRFLYDEALVPLLGLGATRAARASHVEVENDGQSWYVDLRPSDGGITRGFPTRQAALDFEKEWLESRGIPTLAIAALPAPA